MQRCTIEGCENPVYTHALFCLRCLEELPLSTVERMERALLNVRGAPSGRSNDQSTKGAVGLLQAAQHHMEERARTYDAPAGERSMAKTVAAFNALTGKTLSETEGWTFMAILKIARANQGAFRADNYEDLVSYAALAGESAHQENQANESARLDTSLSM